jgi:hypothetical protein
MNISGGSCRIFDMLTISLTPDFPPYMKRLISVGRWCSLGLLIFDFYILLVEKNVLLGRLYIWI